MKKTLTAILFFAFTQLWAQQELGLHYMDEIQQSSYTNPAIIPAEKININLALPIPTLALNAGFSGFSYKDFFKKENDDSLRVDFQSAIDKMSRTNHILFGAQLDYFALSIPIKGVTIGLNVSDKVLWDMIYTREFVDFLVNGNAAYIGDSADVSGIKVNFNQYREIALSGAYEYEPFTFGLRFKYLNGLANIYTKNNKATFYTDDTTYNITLKADYEIHTSAIDTFPDFFTDYFFNSANKGFAIDLGSTYRLNDKITLGASIIDLGFIKWKSFVKSFSGKGEYTYEAQDLNEYFDSDTFTLSTTADTLLEIFAPEQNSNPYTSRLIAKTYLSGTYQLDSMTRVGAILYGEFFNGINPAFTLFAKRKIGKVFTPGLHLSYKNNSVANFGVSSVLDLGPFQMFVVSDNVLGFFNKKAGIPLDEEGNRYILIPRSTKSFNVRFGINWAIGERGKKRTEPKFS